MHLDLLDDSLRVRVYLEKRDLGFRDPICVCFFESCPDDERLFRGDETHIYITRAQAQTLARMLLDAAAHSPEARGPGGS